MSFKQLNLTLTGSAQVLTGGLATSLGDPPIKQIGLQADSANANVIKVGDSAVSATLFSFSIPVPVTNVPYGPAVMDFPKDAVVRLSEIYVLGTNNQKVKGWIVY